MSQARDGPGSQRPIALKQTAAGPARGIEPEKFIRRRRQHAPLYKPTCTWRCGVLLWPMKAANQNTLH